MLKIQFDTNTAVFKDAMREEEAFAILKNVLTDLRNGRNQGLIYDAEETLIGYYACDDHER